MKASIIVLALLLSAGIACNSTASSRQDDIRTVPIQEKHWPTEAEISKEAQDEIRRQGAQEPQPVRVGGDSTKGQVLTTFAGLRIELPADAKSMGVVTSVTCQEGATCIQPPYLSLWREGGYIALITSSGELVDFDSKFGDVRITK